MTNTLADTTSVEALKDLAQAALADVKVREPVSLAVRALTPMADWLLIGTGTSNRHTRALAASVIEKAKAAGVMPLGVEGEDSGEWILIDLGAVIVHVMTAETRAYYQLEKLWDPDWGTQAESRPVAASAAP